MSEQTPAGDEPVLATTSTAPPTRPPGKPAVTDRAPRQADHVGIGLAVWGAAIAIAIVYLLAFPIRIQYWVRDSGFFVEDRKWMPVRDVWWQLFADAPVFGTQWLVRVLLVVSALGVIVASGWALRLILTQEDGVRNDA